MTELDSATAPASEMARVSPKGEIAGLWLGVLGPPLVFLAHLEAGYALSSLACRHDDSLSLHIASIVGILLALGLGLLGLRGWRRSGREWPDSSASLATRDRFLGAVGVLMTALVVLALIAQWIPIFFIHPCR